MAQRVLVCLAMTLSPGRFAWVLGLMIVAGCTEVDEVVPPLCPAPVEKAIPLFSSRAQDVLIVLDRTASMADQQALVSAAAREVAAIIGTGAMDDVHVAVVSSDLGADGVAGCTARGDDGGLRDGAACGVDGHFLAEVRAADGSHTGNHARSLEDSLTCLLSLPASTCPVSQPLAAARRALADGLVDNAGFRRPEAWLSVVVVTDSDDCSLRDRAALSGLAGDGAALEAAVATACLHRGVRCGGEQVGPGSHTGCTGVGADGLEDPQALLAAIELAARPQSAYVGALTAGGSFDVLADGTLAPTCGGQAWPAPRLRGLHPSDSTPAFGEVCGGEVEEALVAMAEGPHWPLTIGCVEGAIDLAAAPGVQPTCRGDLVEAGPGGELVAVQALARCDDPGRDRARPCYELDVGTAACDSGLGFVAHKGHDLPAAPLARLSCDQVCE